jgi:hypothetical protein
MKINEIIEKADVNIEFIYSVRIVEALAKINLNIECDKNEAIKMIERTFIEYKDSFKSNESLEYL